MNVYEIITNRVIEELEKGVCPWKKPWLTSIAPLNFKSKKTYRGINLLLLSMLGNQSPYYLTFKQIKDLGGTLKAGSSGCPITFWKTYQKKVENDLDDEDLDDESYKTRFILRYYTVFNAKDIEGIDFPKIKIGEKLDFNPIQEAEKIVENYPNRPEIIDGYKSAAYVRSLDVVTMPTKDVFISEESYYATLFHELIHSTGNKERLDRDLGKSFGDEAYSKEELIAELGSCFLCAIAGISNETTFNNSAAYIDSWLNKLKKDNRLIISASAQAQKAVEHICNLDAVQLQKSA